MLKLSQAAYVMFFVTDMARAQEFYGQKLGLTAAYQSDEWSEFQLDGFKLALHVSTEAQRVNPRAGEHAPTLIFAADNLQAQHQSLIEQGVQASPLVLVAEYGDTVGVSTDFRDPDGNALSLFAQMPRSEWEKIQEVQEA